LLIIGYIFVKGGQNGLIWLLLVLMKALTTDNRPITLHKFQSRHKTKPYPPLSSPGSVNTKKHTSVGQAVYLNTFVC